MPPCHARGAPGFAVATILCAFLMTGTAEAQLSGKWVLDEDRSDDPATEVQKSEQRGRFGRLGAGASGNVTVFGVQIPVERTQEQERIERSIDSAAIVRSGYLLSAIDEIEIVQDRRFADFKYDTLRTRTYENGAEIKTGYSTIVAEWSENDFVIEHALIGGGEISETYELDGARLQWDVRVQKDGLRTIRISRVYERADTSSGLERSTAR